MVEHDLSVLDYLSDFICCLYGVPSAYGVVTMPFSVREGEAQSRDHKHKFKAFIIIMLLDSRFALTTAGENRTIKLVGTWDTCTSLEIINMRNITK